MATQHGGILRQRKSCTPYWSLKQTGIYILQPLIRQTAYPARSSVRYNEGTPPRNSIIQPILSFTFAPLLQYSQQLSTIPTSSIHHHNLTPTTYLYIAINLIGLARKLPPTMPRRKQVAKALPDYTPIEIAVAIRSKGWAMQKARACRITRLVINKMIERMVSDPFFSLRGCY